MLQDAGLTYQQFKNCRDNLSSWLEHLPRNQLRPSDGPSQIAYKLQAQKVRGWGGRPHPLPWQPLPQGEQPGCLWPPSGQCSKRPYSSDHRGLGQHRDGSTPLPQTASPAPFDVESGLDAPGVPTPPAPASSYLPGPYDTVAMNQGLGGTAWPSGSSGWWETGMSWAMMLLSTWWRS